jgi:hypothetical protein
MRLLFENWRKFLNEEQQYQIYCDMDGVLVDFVGGAVDYITRELQEGRAEELKAEIGRDYITAEDIEMYSPNKSQPVVDFMYQFLQHHTEFWENLPWMPGGKELWNYIAPYNPDILTAAMGYGSEIGKQAWIDKNLQPEPSKVFMSHDKYLWSKPNRILIDDFTKNTIPWKARGGDAILHTDANKTIQNLKDLGL